MVAFSSCSSRGGKRTTKLVHANGEKENEFDRLVAMAAVGITVLLGAAEDSYPNGVDAGAA